MPYSTAIVYEADMDQSTLKFVLCVRYQASCEAQDRQLSTTQLSDTSRGNNHTASARDCKDGNHTFPG